MMTVFYSKDAQFNLTNEEFESFIKNAAGKKVWIPRLKVFLSDMFIWAGEKPDDNLHRTLHDGTKAINKFGVWYLENKQDIKIDLSYYPELMERKEEPIYKFDKPSKFAKGLLN